MVKVSVGRLQADGCGEVSNCPGVVALAVFGDASVVVSVAVTGFDFQRSCVVLQCKLMLASLVIREPTVEERFEVLRV